MCSSTPKAPKPVASAPIVGPESVDETALNARDNEIRRQRARGGRQSTILAGDTAGQQTASVKTALGG